MKLYKCNQKAIKTIIKEHPDDELDNQPLEKQIEYLANYYISEYIKLFFENGENYYRK